MATVYITAVANDRGTTSYPDGFTAQNSRIAEIAIQNNGIWRIGEGSSNASFTRNFVELYPSAISFYTNNTENDGKSIRITLVKI